MGAPVSQDGLSSPTEPKEVSALTGFDPSRCMAELGKLWYSYVSGDHHKDRDCHFIIEQYFSYGDEPYWTAYHSGYVDDGFGMGAADRKERRFTTHDRALDYCIAQTFAMFRRHSKDLPANIIARLSDLSAQFRERVQYLTMVGDTLAIAMEAGTGETACGLDPKDDSAGPQDIAQ